MSEERRRFTRVNFDSNCLIMDGEKSYEAQLLDISLKGALVNVSDSGIYASDKKCELRIELSGSEVVIQVDIKMVHQREDRIGVYFCSIDVDSLTHLRKLIELNVGDVERTLQELFLWTSPN